MVLIFEFKNQDSSVKAESGELVAILDHTVPQLLFSVEMSSFHSPDPKLDTGLKAFGLGKMKFEGEMKTKNIGPDLNPRIIFPIEGVMRWNENQEFVKMSGSLFPLQQANRYRAQLTISTNLQLSDFNVKDEFPRFKDRFYVQIYQSVLNPRPRN